MLQYKCNVSYIYNINALVSKLKQEETCKINFNKILYLTQYLEFLIPGKEDVVYVYIYNGIPFIHEKEGNLAFEATQTLRALMLSEISQIQKDK